MKNIAVLAGGYTSERQISLNSGNQIYLNLDRKLYNPYLIDVRKEGFFCMLGGKEYKVDINSFSADIEGVTTKFDYAYLALHGSPGEDGKVQALLDILGIPYSACDSYSSMVTLNKIAAKKLLADEGIAMAKMAIIRGENPFDVDEIIEKVGLPCFVKPATAGSSFGVTKVYEKDKFIDAINLARTEDTTIIVEEFIKGTEVSCGILKTLDYEQVFPITEIATKNDYFDTEAKYTPGLTNEITPARINEEETRKVQEATSRIYDIIGCSGIVRIDFIIKEGTPYFIEVNSIPGMSAESIVPKQVRTMGLNMTDILTKVIESKLK
ncbi:MAG: D-alanine--D-alanine ligase [Bacteroidales bacterium]|nr:D-alanine--D-alanine ligase [Bacteroidales bacterium]